METSMSRRRAGREDGFALIEVMFAIVILAVGLLGLAALMASLTGNTTQSRYLGTEVMLASEKMEDLNQLDYATYKATTLAPGGTSGLVVANAAVPGYFDTVQISSRSGIVTDQTDQTLVAGTDNLTFQRRWAIESDTPSARVQRVTVLIIPQTGTATERAATFQTTMVRPCDNVQGCN
jgi:prepilin-type N-terminal cleavage/methylation domain-containing protein